MDDENLLIICRACGRKVLMHNMRPDDDGEHMICAECWKRKVGARGASSSNVFGKKEVENTPYQPPKSAMKVQKTEKLVKYVCASCKYKFSRKASQQVEKCPYCGKQNVVLDSALGAEKIIKDALDKKYDW